MAPTPRKGAALVGLASLVVGLTAALPGGPASAGPHPNPAATASTAIDRALSYEAVVRRTAGGVPNISANDYASMGYGTGYAMAEDNVCAISDLVITFSGERSMRRGASAQNVASDSFYQWFIDQQAAQEPLEERQAAVFRGAAAGFNRYLRDTGADGITDPACHGAAWLRPVTELDFRRISRMPFFLSALSGQFLAAAPPTTPGPGGRASGAPSTEQAVADLFDEWRGSNGVALGRESTAGGTGMLLANPHLSWNTPAQRMYALHQTIPGEMNMTGATTLGRVQVSFGATEQVAWTATVSNAKDFTFYRLSLVPGKPTHYMFDGVEHAMDAHEVTVDVPDGAGGTTQRNHTFWTTHFGARLVGGPGFPWNSEVAWAVRSIDPAWRGVESLNETWRAQDVGEYAKILEKYQSQTTNIMVADAQGGTYYTDANPIPLLTDAQRTACAVPGGLDGSRSSCMWGNDPTAGQPGTFGPEAVPHLMRTDHVSNMNDSYWLANPKAPLTGYDGSFGATGTERTLRTRAGLAAIEGRLEGTDGHQGKNFTLSGLQRLMFDNTSQAGVALRDDMVTLCRSQPQVTRPDNSVVDVSEACDVLGTWDLRDDVDSRGAHLFREVMVAGNGGSRLPAAWNYAVPFDVADPVHTPRGLNTTDNPAVLQALATAVAKLRAAGVRLDARLGDVQYVTRNGKRIPMHGGTNSDGLFNIVNAPFNAAQGGYAEVSAGASWIQATEFRADGPVSKGVLSFSQSMDPTSPHFSDMTEMFSRKQWVDLPMSESDVAAGALSTTTLTENESVCADNGWRSGLALTFDDEAQCRAHYQSERAARLREYDARHTLPTARFVGATPTLAGGRRVGDTLTVTPVPANAFQPVATQVTQQWLRDGIPVPGATGPRYRTTASDVGSDLSVRVNAVTGAGASGSVTTATVRVTRALSAVKVRAGAQKKRLVVRARVDAATPVAGKVRVEVVRRGRVVARRTRSLDASGRLLVKVGHRGPGRYRVVVQYLGSDSVAAGRARAKVRVR